MTTPTYAEAVDRLAEASAQLATFAEEQGVSRALTAAALAAEVVHAVTTDPEVERMREQVRAQWAAHQAEAAAHIGSAPQVQKDLAGFVDRFAALADELVAYTEASQELDRRGVALADHAQQLGDPVGAAPQVFEGVVQGLRRDREGMAWIRLFLAGRRGRTDAADALNQVVRQLRPAG